MIGLLQKIHTSTKVIRNGDILQERENLKKQRIEEVERLRYGLKTKLQEQDIDIAEMFKRFDKNGDGVFSVLEFECAFTVLEIGFAKADLRRLISLTDTNKDGRIDSKEFHAMLYPPETS